MHIFLSIYIFYFGALFASFYNVVGIRVKNGESILRQSECPKCNHPIRFIDVIPLFGFLINMGKCHYCGCKIHIKYFLIEVIGGILFMLSYLMFGISFEFFYSLIGLSFIMIIFITLYEHNWMFQKLSYPFMILLSSFIIILSIINDNMYLFNFLSGLLMGIGIILISIKNKSNLVMLPIAICIGLSLNVYLAVITYVLAIMVLMIAKIINKPFSIMYPICIVASIMIIYGNYLIGLIN